MPEKATEMLASWEYWWDWRDCMVPWIVFLLIGQLISSAAILLSLLLLSIPGIHPYLPCWQVIMDHRESALLPASVLLLLSACYTALVRIPIVHISLALLPAVVAEMAKHVSCRRHQESQKRSKLQFSTRLGMHSPI
jgi:hypothetical protein